jgi:hypothetical protein
MPNHRFGRLRVWNCHMDVATDSKTPWARVRKASRARAPDSPWPGEGRTPEQPGQTKKSQGGGR